MKTIDICDSHAGGECLKYYYVKNKIKIIRHFIDIITTN